MACVIPSCLCVSCSSKSAEMTARCSGSIVCEGLGAAVGTLILPGVGTVLVQTLASLIPWII